MTTENKKLRKYLTPDELRAEIVDWSKKTLDRRIANEGFPAIRDGNSWLFDLNEVDLYFKKRRKQG
jgi:hypothetical protein